MEQKFPEDNPTPTMPIEEEPKIDLIKPLEPAKNKGGNFLTVFLSILLLISVVIAGFFAYQTQKLVKEITKLQVLPTPIASIEPSATPDPTANWKVYTNTEFSFKYPQNWQIEDLINGEQVSIYYQPDKTKSVGSILFEKVSQTSFINGSKDANKEMTFGTTAVKCETDNIAKTWCYSTLGNKYLSILIIKENDVDYNKVLDQILSTFKFIEPTTSPQP